MATTIQIDKETVDSLKGIKEYERQTYDDLIKEMIKVFKSVKKRNQYDEFLHKMQQAKMTELWDNNSDEAWENV